MNIPVLVGGLRSAFLGRGAAFADVVDLGGGTVVCLELLVEVLSLLYDRAILMPIARATVKPNAGIKIQRTGLPVAAAASTAVTSTLLIHGPLTPDIRFVGGFRGETLSTGLRAFARCGATNARAVRSLRGAMISLRPPVGCAGAGAWAA